MMSFFKRMLPLLAAFLLGSVLVVFASAEPEKCDWSRSGDVSVTFIGAGASTPEEALKELHGPAANIRIPEASLTQTTGDDRFAETAIDKETGSVSYAVYIDGVHRIQATVEQLSDGTYYPTGFSICYGV
jgi:hypothetical protein